MIIICVEGKEGRVVVVDATVEMLLNIIVCAHSSIHPSYLDMNRGSRHAVTKMCLRYINLFWTPMLRLPSTSKKMKGTEERKKSLRKK